MKKRPSVSESSARRKADSNLRNTSRRAQCRRIAAYLLQRGSGNTMQLREQCNALHPAGRIMELRRAGWRIALYWEAANDSQGRPHRIGRYVLQSAGGAV